MACLSSRVAPLDPRIGDADLAVRVGHGEEAAIRLLMRRHNQTLYRTARSILRDDAEADDAFRFAGDRCNRIIAAVLARLSLPLPMNVAPGTLK